ncbi:MAG: DUF1573 domain-containing protein [Chitinophagaceae bacterium]
MKYFFSLLLFFVVTTVFAQDGIKFSKSTHSFGKIKKDKPVTFVFNFQNTSAKPLIVENATADCGCTTPEYPKEPIMKGKSGSIKVTYNAANIGTFKKNITVKFANQAQPTILSINGEVIDDKAAKAPSTPIKKS